MASPTTVKIKLLGMRKDDEAEGKEGRFRYNMVVKKLYFGQI